MKRIYFIIGEGGVGKSTLIRCLTGIRQAGRPNLRLATGIDVPLWAWMRSMQEMAPPMSPNDVLADITSPQEAAFEYYLIPLRLNAMYGYQSAQDYIDLLGLHCIIMGAAVLSANGVVPTLTVPVPQINIPLSHTIPANGNASTVRRGWGWM
jgi:hypothetical protein